MEPQSYQLSITVPPPVEITNPRAKGLPEALKQSLLTPETAELTPRGAYTIALLVTKIGIGSRALHPTSEHAWACELDSAIVTRVAGLE
jgi:hypothetical protein